MMALASSYKKERINSVLLCVMLFSSLTIPSAYADELVTADVHIPIGDPVGKIYTKYLVHLAWLTAFSVVLYLRCKRPIADEPILPPDASALQRLRHWVSGLLGQRQKGIRFIMEKDGTIRCVPEIPARGLGRIEILVKWSREILGLPNYVEGMCDNVASVQAVCYNNSEQESDVVNPPTQQPTPDAPSKTVKAKSDTKPDATVEGDTGDKPADTTVEATEGDTVKEDVRPDFN